MNKIYNWNWDIYWTKWVWKTDYKNQRVKNEDHINNLITGIIYNYYSIYLKIAFPSCMLYIN